MLFRSDARFAPIYVRTFYVPKFGGPWNHRLMARALARPIAEVRRQFEHDVVLGAWVYPDACALDLLSVELAAPLVAIAQGSGFVLLKLPRHRFGRHRGQTYMLALGQGLDRPNSAGKQVALGLAFFGLGGALGRFGLGARMLGLEFFLDLLEVLQAAKFHAPARLRIQSAVWKKL